MRPAAHRPLQFACGGGLRPDQLVAVAVQLNEIGRRQNVLPRFVVFDALILEVVEPGLPTSQALRFISP